MFAIIANHIKGLVVTIVVLSAIFPSPGRAQDFQECTDQYTLSSSLFNIYVLDRAEACILFPTIDDGFQCATDQGYGIGFIAWEIALQATRCINTANGTNGSLCHRPFYFPNWYPNIDDTRYLCGTLCSLAGSGASQFDAPLSTFISQISGRCVERCELISIQKRRQCNRGQNADVPDHVFSIEEVYGPAIPG